MAAAWYFDILQCRVSGNPGDPSLWINIYMGPQVIETQRENQMKHEMDTGGI